MKEEWNNKQEDIFRLLCHAVNMTIKGKDSTQHLSEDQILSVIDYLNKSNLFPSPVHFYLGLDDAICVSIGQPDGTKWVTVFKLPNEGSN